MACLVVVCSSALLAGCTSAPPPSPLIAGSQAPVVVPGAPGSEGRTAKPGERIGESEAQTRAADVRFAESMIPHHRQALQMAALAAERTTSSAIIGLASRITHAQQPEITAMTSWLTSMGQLPPQSHDHVPGTYGMATRAELDQLRTARGSDFDALFLTLMIRHHEGAVRMAGEERRSGGDRLMRKMARDVISDQQVEITRMRRLQTAP